MSFPVQPRGCSCNYRDLPIADKGFEKKSVVDNHNGIWKPKFQKFVIDFIALRELSVEAMLRAGRGD